MYLTSRQAKPPIRQRNPVSRGKSQKKLKVQNEKCKTKEVIAAKRRFHSFYFSILSFEFLSTKTLLPLLHPPFKAGAAHFPNRQNQEAVKIYLTLGGPVCQPIFSNFWVCSLFRAGIGEIIIKSVKIKK